MGGILSAGPVYKKDNKDYDRVLDTGLGKTSVNIIPVLCSVLSGPGAEHQVGPHFSRNATHTSHYLTLT